MNITDLRIAQARFAKRLDRVVSDRKDAYRLRDEFKKYYTHARIKSMTLAEYAIGSPDRDSYPYHFCYTIEQKLDKLGTITGSPARKFGVYFSKENNKYVFTKKYGDNIQEAFSALKTLIVSLLNDGKNGHLEGIANNKIAPLVKGKILSIYYPQQYLNISSDEDLNHFLRLFNLATPELIDGNEVYKKKALLNFKASDKVMKNWEVDLFTNFLYTECPAPPSKNKGRKQIGTNDLDAYNEICFPSYNKLDFIDLEMLNVKDKITKKKQCSEKPDYLLENKRKKELGNKGEQIVFELERNRLLTEGLTELSYQVKWISLESDVEGYDILSYNNDGTERYIEVKATRSKVGDTNFFISSNELSVAKEYGEKYYIYIVYDILSPEPKVWMSNNIFSEENKDKLLITPTNYRVTINTKKK